MTFYLFRKLQTLSTKGHTPCRRRVLDELEDKRPQTFFGLTERREPVRLPDFSRGMQGQDQLFSILSALTLLIFAGEKCSRTHIDIVSSMRYSIHYAIVEQNETVLNRF